MLPRPARAESKDRGGSMIRCRSTDTLRILIRRAFETRRRGEFDSRSAAHRAFVPATPVRERRRRALVTSYLVPLALTLCAVATIATTPNKIILQGTGSSPIVNPAILTKSRDRVKAQLKVNGKPVSCGKDDRRGYVRRLEGTNPVVWIRQVSVHPLQMTLTPEH